MAIGQIGMSGALAEVVKRGEHELAPTPHQLSGGGGGRSVLGKAKKRGHVTKLLAQVNIVVSFVFFLNSERAS